MGKSIKFKAETMKKELKYFSLAHKLNENHKKLLMENKVHFRANINSLSLISLSEEKPELGTKCSFKKYNSANDIQTLITDINIIKNKSIPKRLTPEKKLQSYIINYALNNNHELPFDKNIKFISSEIAIYNEAKKKKIVTDRLGYNEIMNQLCIIELKYDRQEKRLIEQVNNFENVIDEEPEFFSQLLSIHGFENTISTQPTIAKFVVWPHEKTSPKSELKREHIIEITFHSEYSFQKFN